MEKSAFRMMEHVKRLYAVVSRMEKAEGNVPQMEIDVLLEELRNMYAEALMLNGPESRAWQLEMEATDEKNVERDEVGDEPAAEKEKMNETEVEPAEMVQATEEPMAETKMPMAEEKGTAEPMAVAATAATALHVAEALADMSGLEFAKEESELTESGTAEMPSMEELEGKTNDELFVEETTEPEAMVEETVIAAEEHVSPEVPELFAEETTEPKPMVGEMVIAAEEPVSPEVPELFAEETTEPETMVEETVIAAEEPVSPEIQVDETTIEVAPIPEPAPVVKTIGEQMNDAPKTLWEQLQSKQQQPTLADMFQTEQQPMAEQPSPWSVEPIIAEAQQQPQLSFGQENTPATVEEPAPVTEEPMAKEEPVTEVAAPTANVEPAPEKAEEPTKAQPSGPSLLDLLRQSNQQDSKPAEMMHTLGETLVRGAENNTESHINRNKVSDLRTVININDKFSFMSELFHNNMKAYNDFILRLNAIEGREEALAYVEEVAGQYGWVPDSLAVHTFYSILDRKF